MRNFTFIAFFLFTSSSSFGQTKYKIKYSEPTKLKIISETKFDKETFYEVEFLNSKKKVVKSINKSAGENHSKKNGYEIFHSITYYFHSDNLEMYHITVDLVERTINKTVNNNKKGKSTGWESYSYNLKLSKDSIKSIVENDYYLNNPNKFPKTNLTLETKMVRKFEKEKIVYKCYYERYGNLKTALPAREQFFKYNIKGQLTEHISNPKSDAGGTAFMKQPFDYNEQNQLIRKEWFENSKLQATEEFSYTDSTIISEEKFYEIYGNGDPKKFTRMTKIYNLNKDGYYYSTNSFRQRFVICNDTEY
jgi:hypothetical protein